MGREREPQIDGEMSYGGYRSVQYERPTSGEIIRTGISFLNVILEEKFQPEDLEAEEDSPKLRLLREGLVGQLKDRGYRPEEISALTGLSLRTVRPLMEDNDWISTIVTKSVSLKERIRLERPPLTPSGKKNAVFAVLLHNYPFPPEDILGPKRGRELVEARQAGEYLFHKLLDLNFKEIGRDFGGRDHSTIIHAVGMVLLKSLEDPDFASKIELMENESKDLLDS